MSKIICAARFDTWKRLGLKDYGDFAECVTYCNQEDDYCDSLRGEWWYADPLTRTLYYGSFGQDHSPGSSHNTYAEVFETNTEFNDAVMEWDAKPEYLEEDEEPEEEEREDHSCDQCEALMINGLYCHETGCPNRHKVKVDGEWVKPEEETDEKILEPEYGGEA